MIKVFGEGTKAWRGSGRKITSYGIACTRWYKWHKQKKSISGFYSCNLITMNVGKDNQYCLCEVSCLVGLFFWSEPWKALLVTKWVATWTEKSAVGLSQNNSIWGVGLGLCWIFKIEWYLRQLEYRPCYLKWAWVTQPKIHHIHNKTAVFGGKLGEDHPLNATGLSL